MANSQLRSLVKQAITQARAMEQAPALEVFPTLQRFASQRYAPFCPRSFDYGNKERNFKRRTRMVWHLYHDLGVMVFSGATDEQVRRIGNILKAVTANPGGPARLAGVAYPEQRRRRIYRISSEGLPLEEEWVAQEGGIDLVGLSRVSRTICSELSKEIEAVASEAGMQSPKVKLGEVTTMKTDKSRGLVHPTANGPRRLPIDAHVFIDFHVWSMIQTTVELYTVGTSQYLGTVGFTAWLYHDVDGKQVQLRGPPLQKLVEELPSPVQWSIKEFESVETDVRTLEREIWTHKHQRLVEEEKEKEKMMKQRQRQKQKQKQKKTKKAEGDAEPKNEVEAVAKPQKPGAVAASKTRGGSVAKSPEKDLAEHLTGSQKEEWGLESEAENTEVGAGDGPMESQIERQDDLFNLDKRAS